MTVETVGTALGSLGPIGPRDDYDAELIVNGAQAIERWSVRTDDVEDRMRIDDSVREYIGVALPHVPRLLAIDVASERVELDFAWTPRVFLATLLASEGGRDGLALPLVRGVIRDVAAGLAALHARHESARHGCISVTQVAIGVDGATWFDLRPYQPVTDFNGKGGPMRFPRYETYSREWVMGEPRTSRSDVWTLGVTAFHALTGRTPFRRESSFHTLDAIRRNDRPRVSDSKGDMPAAIDDVIEHMLMTATEARIAPMDIVNALDDGTLAWAKWDQDARARELRALVPREFDALLTLDDRARAALLSSTR